MLLFTLLTTLFFSNPAASAKDTAQPARLRPSVGLFYMTGPRAYEISGNTGLCLRIPLHKFYSSFLHFGVGGGLSYQEHGLHLELDSTSSTPVVYIPITYTKATSFIAFLGYSKDYLLNRRLSLTAGIQFGYSVIKRHSAYKTLPTLLTRSAWVNDSTPTTTYEYNVLKNSVTNYWITLTLGLTYRLSKCLSVSTGLQLGPRINVEKMYGSGERFTTTSFRSLYINGLYDPYNSNNGFVSNGIQSLSPPNKPLINRFDMWGYSSVNLTVFYLFP